MFLITNYITPFIINFFALALVNSGVLFMSGKLAPNLLETSYNNTSLTIRTIAVVALCIVPANIIISQLFKNYPASTIAVSSIIATVVILTVIGILVDNIKLSAPIIIAFFCALIACVNLIYQLQK